MPDNTTEGAKPSLPPAADPAETDPEGVGTGAPDDGLHKALVAERTARREAERQLRSAQDRVRSLEFHDLRREVAAAKGLSPSQAHRLVGQTREELESDADDLLQAFAPPEPAGGQLRTQPTEKLTSGAAPGVEAFDAGKVADQILNR
jgi:hypothetical protein